MLPVTESTNLSRVRFFHLKAPLSLSVSVLYSTAHSLPEALTCHTDRCRHDYWPKSLFSSTLTPMSQHLLHKTQATTHNTILMASCTMIMSHKPHPNIISHHPPFSVNEGCAWNPKTGEEKKRVKLNKSQFSVAERIYSAQHIVTNQMCEKKKAKEMVFQPRS